jgi:hypothetical protein
MIAPIVRIIALSAGLSVAALGSARADCESDMDQLDQAMKASTLTPEGKAALQDAKAKAVAAVKKDDDAACNKAIAEAMAKAGMKMK